MNTIQGEVAELLIKARDIVADRPPSRENSLTLTKIDEALMWNGAARMLSGEKS